MKALHGQDFPLTKISLFTRESEFETPPLAKEHSRQRATERLIDEPVIRSTCEILGRVSRETSPSSPSHRFLPTYGKCCGEKSAVELGRARALSHWVLARTCLHPHSLSHTVSKSEKTVCQNGRLSRETELGDRHPARREGPWGKGSRIARSRRRRAGLARARAQTACAPLAPTPATHGVRSFASLYTRIISRVSRYLDLDIEQFQRTRTQVGVPERAPSRAHSPSLYINNRRTSGHSSLLVY